MYIELFLLDNFIFNFLIIKLAAALSRLKFSIPWAVIICVFMSIYAAITVAHSNVRWLMCSFFAKMTLCFICSVPFFVVQRKIAFTPIAFIFIATLIAGGLVFALSMNGKGIFRLLLYPALILSVLPTMLRYIHRSRAKSQFSTTLSFMYKNELYTIPAIWDSGNLLFEPVSGLPVIVVYEPSLLKAARTPIPCADTNSDFHMLYAFMPEWVSVDQVVIDAYIAPTNRNPRMKALVPVTLF